MRSFRGLEAGLKNAAELTDRNRPRRVRQFGLGVSELLTVPACPTARTAERLISPSPSGQRVLGRREGGRLWAQPLPLEAQPPRRAVWRRSVPDTPFNSTGPISVNETGIPPAASTTSWLTNTSPGLA
jgi:hypothetical protein